MAVGGINPNGQFISSNVIWMYNIYTEQWRIHQIPKGKITPGPIAGACAVAIGRDIYIFGGESSGQNGKTNNVWKLTRTPQGCFNWSNIEFENDVKLPSPRAWHSGWEYGECMWVFGGFGGLGLLQTKYLSDHGDFIAGRNNQLLCFNSSTLMWTNPQCFGKVPLPRLSHCTTIINNNVFLYGGQTGQLHTLNDFFELDMISRTWTQLKTGQTQPHGRCSASLTAISDRHLVLHGGRSSSEDFNDTWIVDLPSQTWRQHASNHDHTRHNHTGSLGINKRVIIIGGITFPSSKTSARIFHVILEPESLQKLAMKTIYSERAELTWKSFPPKLIARLGLAEKEENGDNE